MKSPSKKGSIKEIYDDLWRSKMELISIKCHIEIITEILIHSSYGMNFYRVQVILVLILLKLMGAHNYTIVGAILGSLIAEVHNAWSRKKNLKKIKEMLEK